MKALAEEIVKPGIEAITMFRNVQLRVKQAIGQDPWLTFPTLPAVYFAGIEANRPTSEAAQAWDRVKDATNPSILEAYVRQFGDTVYGAMARGRLEQLRKQTTALLLLVG
jgi:hypothetical protein